MDTQNSVNGENKEKETTIVSTVNPIDSALAPVVTSTEIKPAVAPDTLTLEQRADINKHADDIIAKFLAAKGSDSLTIQDSIVNVGVQDQKTVSSSVALLQDRIGTVFNSPEKTDLDKSVSEDMTKLQTTLERVNPKDIQKQQMYRWVYIIPFFGNRIVRALKQASTNGMTMKEFIDHLQASLQAGETGLRRDNADLKVIFETLEQKQVIIQSDAYLAETIMNKLDDIRTTEKDPKKLATINNVLYKVSARAQDLRAMENVHEQFFQSIIMLRNDNDNLIATIRRMIDMGMSVVNVSFAIRVALQHQQNSINMARATREFLGNQLLSNATLIQQHTKEIGDLYKEPVIAMDKLEASIQLLSQAIDETNSQKAIGIEAAKTNIAKLKVMTETIKNKTDQLPQTDIKSIEASNVLQLNAGK
jgi:uncharacterized protein YaaN involved in tellurite resistance